MDMEAVIVNCAKLVNTEVTNPHRTEKMMQECLAVVFDMQDICYQKEVEIYMRFMGHTIPNILWADIGKQQ